MGNINSLDSIDAIHDLLFTDDGDLQVKIDVSFRGRKFSTNGEEFCLNDLVKQVQAIAKISLPHAPQGPTDKMDQIIERIKWLDQQGEEVLDQKNILIKVITFFCKFFGNLFFDRNETLEEVKVEVRSNQIRLTREGKYQIFSSNEGIHKKSNHSFESDVTSEEEADISPPQPQLQEQSAEIENVLEEEEFPLESRLEPQIEPEKVERQAHQSPKIPRQTVENQVIQDESKKSTIKVEPTEFKQISPKFEKKQNSKPIENSNEKFPVSSESKEGESKTTSQDTPKVEVKIKTNKEPLPIPKSPGNDSKIDLSKSKTQSPVVASLNLDKPAPQPSVKESRNKRSSFRAVVDPQTTIHESQDKVIVTKSKVKVSTDLQGLIANQLYARTGKKPPQAPQVEPQKIEQKETKLDKIKKPRREKDHKFNTLHLDKKNKTKMTVTKVDYDLIDELSKEANKAL